ncbi:hypothetical protein [Enhygromyxa salina]|uniref:hypothetical protein n=1 Tax=Enhygromyxa salina TaxID=215803 RepID=UPI001293D37B|nr:hypothetical protein [Enhygromyxa salina]
MEAAVLAQLEQAPLLAEDATAAVGDLLCDQPPLGSFFDVARPSTQPRYQSRTSFESR